MDEKTEKLLVEHGVLVLPEEIDHNTYVLMVEALIIMRGKRMALYCRGDGGCSRSALAIVDMLRDHGDVDGILYGEANSSHAAIWAACARRWVSPNAMIGVHMVSWDSLNTRMDAKSAHLIKTQFEIKDRLFAETFAEASSESVEWWLSHIQMTSGAVQRIGASWMIESQMAKPISKYNMIKAGG